MMKTISSRNVLGQSNNNNSWRSTMSMLGMSTRSSLVIGGLRKSFRRRRDSADASEGASSYDFSIHATEDEDEMTSWLSSKLELVAKDKSVSRLKLNDFVENGLPQQFVELKELLTCDKRPWQSVKFQDTVQGSQYRRWLMKKYAVQRRLCCAPLHHRRIAIKFVTRMEIDFSEMNKEAIVMLLESLPKDKDVTTLVFKGYVQREDLPEIVQAITTLVEADVRAWEGIIFHPSFEGSNQDYPWWVKSIKKYSRELDSLSTRFAVPMGIKIVDSRQ